MSEWNKSDQIPLHRVQKASVQVKRAGLFADSPVLNLLRENRMIYLDVEEEWCLFCEIKEWGSIGGILFWFVRNQGRFYGFLVRNVFKIRLLRRFLSKMYI